MSWLRLMEENLQEKESSGEAPSLPVAGKKRSLRGLIRDMWAAYLIEIIVIILGISISLGLEQWRDSSREYRLENIYLKNLLTDVDVDLQSLQNVIGGTEKVIVSGDELLKFVRNSGVKEPPYQRVDSDVRAILGRPKFYSSDASFSDLKSSGNLHLIKDVQLKNLLFSFYNQTQNIQALQDAEQQATINLSGNYFLKHFPMDDLGPVTTNSEGAQSVALVKDFEFENHVLLRVLNRKELLQAYQAADSAGSQLKDELAKKIHSR
jgi:hypothetical protein